MSTAVLETEREELAQMVRDLPDDKVIAALGFVRNLCDDGRMPNAETIKILKDSEAGRNLLGPYHNPEEMFRDFGIDVDTRANHGIQS